MAVQGPRAEDVVAALLGDWVRDIRFFSYRPAELDGIPMWVGRAGWSKQGGIELYLCDHKRGTDLWTLVADAGAAFGIGPGSPNYVERVESALLSFRADTEWDTDPFEVGLGRWVDPHRDSDFIGRDALRVRAARGPKRRLVGLLMDGEPVGPNAHPWPVVADGVSAGRVRAAAYSPRLERNIALALLQTRFTEAGTALTVETEHGDVLSATVCGLPFVA
jgi:aminomethyltransferase